MFPGGCVGTRLTCRIVIKLSDACRNLTSGSAGRIVTGLACRTSDGTEATYIAADGDAITMAFDRIDPARVVRGHPARDVRSRAGQRNYSGLFWSATTQEHLTYESLLERDRLLLADFDSTVGWLACQPFWLRGSEGSAFRRHVPDILLEHRDGSYTVIDVKAPWFLEKPEVVTVLKWTGRVCKSRGWRYEVWTGGDRIELSNVRFLSLARRSAFIDRTAAAAVSAIARHGMTIDAILGLAVDDKVNRPAALVTVLERLWASAWSTGLRSPLSGASVISMAGSAA